MTEDIESIVRRRPGFADHRTKGQGTVKVKAQHSPSPISPWMEKHVLKFASEKNEALLLIAKKYCGEIKLSSNGMRIDRYKWVCLVYRGVKTFQQISSHGKYHKESIKNHK